MPTKNTIRKRDKAAGEILNGLKSDNPDVRYDAYKKAVDLTNGMQKGIVQATTPCKEVQIPFIMAALAQSLRGLTTAYSQYVTWADYIQLVLDVETTIKPIEDGDDDGRKENVQQKDNAE